MKQITKKVETTIVVSSVNGCSLHCPFLETRLNYCLLCKQDIEGYYKRCKKCIETFEENK